MKMCLSCCSPHNKTLTDELLLIDEQREWLFETESGCCEDCWNDNKGCRTLHGLHWWSSSRVWEDQLQNIAWASLMKQQQGWRGSAPGLKEGLLWVNAVSSAAGCREMVHERESQLMPQTSRGRILDIGTATPAFSIHHPDPSAPSASRPDPLPGKRLWLAGGSDGG